MLNNPTRSTSRWSTRDTQMPWQALLHNRPQDLLREPRLRIFKSSVAKYTCMSCHPGRKGRVSIQTRCGSCTELLAPPRRGSHAFSGKQCLLTQAPGDRDRGAPCSWEWHLFNVAVFIIEANWSWRPGIPSCTMHRELT